MSHIFFLIKEGYRLCVTPSDIDISLMEKSKNKQTGKREKEKKGLCDDICIGMVHLRIEDYNSFYTHTEQLRERKKERPMTR